MKKIIKVITTVVAVAAAAAVGKVVYDVMADKKRREEEDFEFFNDIDDDFVGMTATPSMPEPEAKAVSRPEAKKEAKEAASKVAAKTTAPKATTKTESPKDTRKTESPKATTKTESPKATSKTSAPKATKKTGGSSAKKASDLTCKDVIDCTAKLLNVSAEDILSKSRKGDVANARRVAIYLCATMLDVSNSTICEEFGGIASSSVSNAKKIVADKMKEDDELAADVEDIMDELKG